jgi:hypothetical protein
MSTRNTYRIERPIDALYASGHRRITLAAGTYSTADPEVKRFLACYPGVTFLSAAADEPKRNSDNAFLPVQPVLVTNVAGLQMKEKQTPTSGRITAGEELRK